ncbi:MAG: restriction endonuclease subunit S [Gallionella sp.]
MSLPRYPEYKDSGVAWLGEVPRHWDVLPCRAFVDEQTAKNDDGKNEDYLSLMANVGIIPYADKGDVGNKKPEDLTKCKLVSKGDFVINSMNYGIGSYGLSALDGICSPVYIVLRPRLDKIESRYAFRIFENRAFQTFAQSFGNGILEHRAAINWDILKSIGVGIPPKEEQAAILNFLDRETGNIDALVAEQEKLIALLKEKRQAVISHAVTNGLNPAAKMKDSGIEWLGEVPEHWDVVPLGHLATLIQTGPFGSQLHSEDYVEGETPVINPFNIQEGKLVADWSCTVTQEIVARLSHHKLKLGDIVFARRGEMGRCAMVTVNEVNWLCGTGSLNVRLSRRAIPEFVSTYLRTEYVRELLKLESVGSTMDNLNTQILSRVSVPLPALDEQQAITSFLDRETAKLDALTAEANRAIALLQERRSALISAAVTGKIDVRVAQLSEAA